MVRVFSGKNSIILLFLFFVTIPSLIMGGTNVHANYVSGDGGNPAGGACGTNSGQAYYWDTCFGLSWQYYEWPKENTNPITGRLSFWCGTTNDNKNYIGCTTNELNAKGAAYFTDYQYDPNSRRIIIDPDSTKQTSSGECRDIGGFWYLGYQVYSPTNSLSLDVVGWQVGRPSVKMLDSYVNVGTTNEGARLYPFGRSGLINSDVNPNTDTHKTLEKKGFKPATCNGWNCNITNAFSNAIQPRIDYGNNFGSYKVATAKYYASTQEVYNQWLTVAPAGENFQDINWFCAADPNLSGAVYGSTKVTVDSSSQQTSWDESNTTVNAGTIQVTQGTNKTVTFRHYIKDMGRTKYSIERTDSLDRSKSDVSNQQYVPFTDGEEQLVMSRTATLAYDEVDNGQEICDVLTYNDGNGTSHTRKACVTVEKPVNVAAKDISSATNMVQSDNTSNTQTAAATNASPSVSKDLNTVYRIITDNNSQTVTFKFNHAISGSGTAGTSAKDVNYSIRRYDGSNWNNIASNQKTTITIPAGSGSSTNTVRSNASYEVSVSSNTNKTVCEDMSVSYSGANRYTKTCATVIGNTLTGSSTITQKNNTSNKKTVTTTNGNEQSGSLSTINITVAPGSSESITFQFAHSMTLAGGVNGKANGVSYTVARKVGNGSWTNIDSGTKNLATSSSTPSHNLSVNTNEYQVSSITASTDTTVCERLIVSYSGNTRTSIVCGRIKGNTFSVAGNSGVGQTSVETSTNWGSSIAEITYNVHTPYGGTTTKNAYFKHEVRATNTLSGTSASVSYQIYRGNNKNQDGSALSGASGTKAFSNGGGTAQTAWDGSVNNNVVSPDSTTTICQKLQYTYGNSSSKTPNACINFKGVAPTFSGSSTVSAAGSTSKTTSTNGGTQNLDDIVLKVAAGKTVSKTISFSHSMTATSTLDDAKGKSTGSMSYTIDKSYTTNGSGSFSSSFPSNARTVSGGVSSDSTDVTVGPDESKEVCQTLTFTGWSSKVCGKVIGELSLPNIQSQSGVSYKGSTKTTTNWENNKTVTAEERRIPVKYTEDNTGGATFTVDFSHQIKTLLSELDEQNTGSVPFTVTTSGAINNDPYNGTFGPYTVTSSSPNNEQTIYITSKDAKVKIGQTVTVCQTLSFTYKGTNYNSTACGKFTGFDATPQGKSVAKFNDLTADTEWINGEVRRIAVDVTNLSMDNIESKLIFKHFIRMTGKFDEDIPVTIMNSYNDKYSSSLTYKYRGNSDTSYAETDIYGAAGGRPTAITHEDALKMIEIGSVCETLDFTYDGLQHLSVACIDFVQGNFEVGNGLTRSETTVKKRNINTGSTWSPEQQEIYAKPTDEISFTHYYYPGAQATRYTAGDESVYKVPANNGKTVLIPPRNAWVETSNAFTIQNRENTNSFVSNNNNYSFSQSGQILLINGNTFTGVVGDYNSSTIYTEATRITANAVGAIGDSAIRQSLYTTYGTNSSSGHHTANCGSGCIVTYRNGAEDMWHDYTRNMTYGESSYATVNVPYNYTNTAGYDTGSSYVYAGDTITTSGTKINVEKRYNNLVGEEYATKTPETTIRLYSFYTEDGDRSEGADWQQNGVNTDPCAYYQSQLGYTGCTKIGENVDVFNSSNNLNGVTESAGISESTFNVPDVKAGSKICVGISIYPAASTDTEPSNGKTYISRAFCRIIAKKPTFQIWGGSLYSAGNVKSYESRKYLLDGINLYTPIRDTEQTGTVFGSWVEYGIIANGIVSGVSSGAATGYAYAGLGVDASNPGGNTSTSFCDRSRLSFSNTNCMSGTTGQFGTSGESSAKQTIRQKYIANAVETDDRNNGSLLKLNLSDSSSYTEKDGVRYTYTSGDVAITASNKLSAGVTHVIYAKGSVIIYGNGAPISYNDGSYSDISDIPQYIIIADGNIHIDSEVTRVDAILVTNGTINTCTSFDAATNHLQIAGKEFGTNNITGVYCGKQLRINGTVIADMIKLYRIYGASTGLNSIVPAEIINYTPTIYIWGSGNASNSKPEVHTTYQHELAPRQ